MQRYEKHKIRMKGFVVELKVRDWQIKEWTCGCMGGDSGEKGGGHMSPIFGKGSMFFAPTPQKIYCLPNSVGDK